MDPYQSLLARLKQQHTPYAVTWELTHRCNLACFMCYNVPRTHPELSTEEALDVLEQLARAGVLRLTFTGGEVLTRSDFLTIARRARELDFAIDIKTNATLITPHLADALAALHPVSVEVSLLGATPETVQQIMGGQDTFERILTGVRLLLDRGVRVTLNSLMMRINLRERQAMMALAHELGIPHRVVFKMSPDDDGNDKSRGQQLSFEEMAMLYGEMCEPFHSRPDHSQARTCSVGLHTCLIDPYGVIFPCVELRIPAGSLRQQPFETIWREAPIFRELRERHTLAHMPACRACPLQTYCEGRCSGAAWKERGDLYAPHTLACRQAQARYHSLHPTAPTPSPPLFLEPAP